MEEEPAAVAVTAVEDEPSADIEEEEETAEPVRRPRTPEPPGPRFDDAERERFLAAYHAYRDRDGCLGQSGLRSALNKLSGAMPSGAAAAAMLATTPVRTFADFLDLLSDQAPTVYRPNPENDPDAIFRRAMERAQQRRLSTPPSAEPPPPVDESDDDDDDDESDESDGLEQPSTESNDGNAAGDEDDGWSFD